MTRDEGRRLLEATYQALARKEISSREAQMRVRWVQQVLWARLMAGSPGLSPEEEADIDRRIENL